MYRPHAALESPPDDATLWKYLDFTKFVSLLDRRSLHFSRTDKLDDPFEGTYPRMPGLSESDRQELETISAIHQSSILVDCWHGNPYESEAMWKLYADWERGIAVRTTFRDMRESFTCSEDIFIGLVRYIDYETEEIDLSLQLEPYITKRKSFEHEREVRAISVLTEYENGQPVSSEEKYAAGLYHEVDLDRLIGEVLVAPRAADWFVELVGSVMHRYGLEADVRRSTLADPPPWRTTA